MAAATALLLTLVPTLVLTVVLTAASLAVLWWTISIGLDLSLALMDRATQASRDELALERIQRQARDNQRRLHAARQQRQGWSLTDLDGQRRWLERSQLEGFALSCRQELELLDACSWSELRRHWRRSSLRWHPDHGGDPANWLRKQRAYEALRQLSRDASASPLARSVQPALLRSRWRSRLRSRLRFGLHPRHWRGR